MSEPRLSRKEVAQLAGVTVDTVRRNEARLGLVGAKVSFNARVWYRQAPALAALKARGLVGGS